MSTANRFIAPARLIAALTLLSRVLGLGREMIYAYFLGATPALSSFTIAWQIPNLSRRLFGEGALSAAFIPALTDCMHNRGAAEARRLAGAVFTLLAIFLTAVVVVAELGVAVAHGFCPSLTLRLVGVLLPYMPLICLTAMLGGVLNVLNRFAAPASAPVILNVFVITGAALGGWVVGLRGSALLYLVCGAHLVGGVFQLALMGVNLRWVGFWPKFALRWHDPEVRRIATTMAPMILGMSVIQINTLADSMIALFFVPDGRGPAILRYAQTLYQLPLGVFGVALATAIFPLLSARASAGDLPGLTRAAEQGTRMSLFVGIPSAVGLCLIAEPLVRAFFEQGEFKAADTVRTARTLFYYGAAVWAYFLQQILVRTFYAMKNHRTPVRIGITMVAVNLILNLILVRRLGEAGVALATAICAVIQAAWLVLVLHARLPSLRGRWLLAGTGRVVLAAIALAGAVQLLVLLVGHDQWSAIRPGLQVVMSIGVGAAAYAAAARALHLNELRELLKVEN